MNAAPIFPEEFESYTFSRPVSPISPVSSSPTFSPSLTLPPTPSLPPYSPISSRPASCAEVLFDADTYLDSPRAFESPVAPRSRVTQTLLDDGDQKCRYCRQDKYRNSSNEDALRRAHDTIVCWRVLALKSMSLDRKFSIMTDLMCQRMLDAGAAGLEEARRKIRELDEEYAQLRDEIHILLSDESIDI